MTTSCVVDVSAAAAVLVREPDALRVIPVLFGLKRALVPQIFHLELANVARTKIRRRELAPATAEALLREIDSWPLDVRVVAWDQAWPLAMEFGLTLYDAAYLHLAVNTKSRILSLDAQLVVAAGPSSLLEGE